MTRSPDDALWSAIADPSRRRVVDLLLEQGEASASALAVDLPFSRQAVMKHLAVLEDAGLVARRRDGREVRYRVDPDRLDRARDAMAQVAHTWDLRLRAIKRIAEASHRQATRER